MDKKLWDVPEIKTLDISMTMHDLHPGTVEDDWFQISDGEGPEGWECHCS